ncbi:MAG: DNA repair protein RecN, partial [Ruminococcaceae bacterium]|nr:DNA repair protein RecN [Oscillospiraceae bacterium]
MLTSLHIENIAVIRRADLDLEKGFSALTGETGAGKSMIVDSINLLLGNRTSREMIRSGEASATVSAVFEELSDLAVEYIREMGIDVEDASIMLSRTITADGRSQTRLDGRVITQAVQREIARLLISIQGQADSQNLLQKAKHRELLDAYGMSKEALADYRAAFEELKKCRKEVQVLSQDSAEKLRLCEMLKYQIEDIDSMKLKVGEEEALIKERDRLSNLERINKQTGMICRLLRDSEKGNAYDVIRRAETLLESLNGLVDDTDNLCARLSFAASEIEDVAETVRSYMDDDREDPTARIDRIEGRLEGIAKLKRKYGADVAAVLAFRSDAAARLETLETSDERLAVLQRQLETLTKTAEKHALALRQKRKEAAKEIVKQVTESLAFLDMPKVRFEIAINPTELGEHGGDDIEFLIATNPGEPPLPLSKIASGGELSRIMLALRSVLNDHDGVDTVIFDEIDTGVSGKTSRKIGIKLKETAKGGTQVLCVTHSAQIASLADNHYRITKHERDGRAETDVLLLGESARVDEIARILGSIEP